MTTLATQTPVQHAFQNAPAISPTPVVGTVYTIRLGLTPATIVLFSAPATVAIVMAVAWVILTSAGLPLYANEMLAGALVSAIGGMFASIPLFVLMGKAPK